MLLAEADRKLFNDALDRAVPDDVLGAQIAGRYASGHFLRAGRNHGSGGGAVVVSRHAE